MIALPHRLAQRALALAILLLLLGIVWRGILAPLLDWAGEEQDAAEQSLKLIAGFEHAAAARPALEDQLRALHAREASLTGFVGGASTALAAAQLQVEIRKIIESNGGEIKSVQNLPAAKKEDFEKIDIRYDIQAPMSALGAMLYQIETHNPALFVEAVGIGAPDTWRPDGHAAGEPKLLIHWSIHGYRRAEEK